MCFAGIMLRPCVLPCCLSWWLTMLHPLERSLPCVPAQSYPASHMQLHVLFCTCTGWYGTAAPAQQYVQFGPPGLACRCVSASAGARRCRTWKSGSCCHQVRHPCQQPCVGSTCIALCLPGGAELLPLPLPLQTPYTCSIPGIHSYMPHAAHCAEA